MPSDGVENAVRKVVRLVRVKGRIRVGGARATGDSFVCFFVLFFVLTVEFASVMYEKEKRDCSAEGRATGGLG